MNMKATTTLQDTFERNTLMAIYHGHLASTGHDIFSDSPGVRARTEPCKCCTYLKAMDQALNIEPPEFTEDDLTTMGRLLMIEHDFASKHAANVICNYCQPVVDAIGRTDRDTWYNTDARRGFSSADEIADAVTLLEHRKALQRHPQLAHLVRPLDSAHG